MKTPKKLLAATAFASLFAASSFAQGPAPSTNPCESEERTILYTKYFNEKKNTTDQRPAFETAKQYLAKFEAACSDQYSKAVRKFHDAYATATAKANMWKAFGDAANAKDARKTIEVGKQLAAAEPDNPLIPLLIAHAAYDGAVTKGSPAFQDAAVTSEAVSAANKSIEMIQAGKEPKDGTGNINWAAFRTRDEALAWANYFAGTLQYKSAPEAAKRQLIVAAQSDAPAVREQPTVYTVLAFLLDAERVQLTEEYNKFTEENDRSRAVLANINHILDRQIDAYARAVAFEKDPARRTGWMATLTELYKARNKGSEVGLEARIAAVRTTPLLAAAASPAEKKP